MAIATIVATTFQGLVNPNNNQAPPPTPPPRGKKYYYECLRKNKAPTFDGSRDSENDVVECTVSYQQMKISADTLLKKFSSWLSPFVGDCDTTAFGSVGTTAFCLIQQKRSFDNPADALHVVNQQMRYLVFISICISKIAKRRHLIKLTRHRFIAKGISRWKNAYAYQQENSSKRFSSRSS
ncbi:hypothetical protein F511_02166 [Dorcoceras hygrometricum]|uniref:Uncharacterized protein n=1 Tax=Dorcoceras hygrometricum TaxID=472368 RepID=A0A2Z7BN73_9LAMI|nr:hypothetical protein F511_02166 [Dorcoceras hygrometricum]